MSALVWLARKEAAGLLLGAHGLLLLLALTIALSVFALLFIADAELSLLDNAQVVYDMTATATVVGALIAVALGSDSIAGERERGTLVPLLLIPAPPHAIVLGKVAALLVAGALCYLVTLPYLWAVGSTGQNLARAAGALGLIGGAVVLIFGLLAIGLSARSTATLQALLVGLVLLAASASPLVVGTSLRQTAIGRAFDIFNPMSAATNSYDSLIIDSDPLSAQAPRLGVLLLWLGASFAFAIRGAARLRP